MTTPEPLTALRDIIIHEALNDSPDDTVYDLADRVLSRYDALRTPAEPGLRGTIRIRTPDDQPGDWTAKSDLLPGTPYTYSSGDVAVMVDWSPTAEPTEPCWFCRRPSVVDALIAGYDTFDERRLACLACNERMQGNWRREP